MQFNNGHCSSESPITCITCLPHFGDIHKTRSCNARFIPSYLKHKVNCPSALGRSHRFVVLPKELTKALHLSERITASSINPCVSRTYCATLRIHKKQSFSILEKHSREKFTHLKTFSPFSTCSCHHRVFASWKQKGARGNLANGSEPETLPASCQRPLTRLLQGTSLVTLHRCRTLGTDGVTVPLPFRNAQKL